MNWGIFGLRSYWYIIQVLELLREQGDSLTHVLIILWALAAYLIPCIFWIPQIREKREAFCISETVIGGSLLVYLLISTGETTYFYFIPALSIGYMISRKVFWIAPVVLLLPYASTLSGELSFWKATGLISDLVLFLAIGFWIGFIGNAYRTNSMLMIEIDKKNKLLTQYALQIERLTLLEERNRMSKELHDTLGHSYISLVMGLDAAIALLDKNPQGARDKLLRLRDLTESNVDEMRKLVHASGEDEMLMDQIVELIESFKEFTGTEVELRIDGTEQVLSSPVRQTLLRIVQEAFTNAVKHGGATTITLEFHFSSDQVNMTIRDNGKGAAKIKEGFGLTTMRNRLQPFQGQLQVLSSPSNGTQLLVTIPITKGDTY